MNIALQDHTETHKTLTVTLEPEELGRERAAVVAEFNRAARVKGFRPGKVPEAMLEKRFAKEIDKEVRERVLRAAFREAMQKHKLEVAAVRATRQPELHQAEIEVDVLPDFALPEYTGLALTVPEAAVTDAEVDATIEALRRERASFEKVERPSASGDYLKVSYTGVIDGKPVKELVPDRALLGEAANTWEEAGSNDSLIPGLGLGLLGVPAGEKREIPVTFPADFNAEALRGLTATYTVEVLEIRERRMPELDAALLKELEVQTVEALREKTRASLERRKLNEVENEKRRQAGDKLTAGLAFAVPESVIEDEVQGMLRQFLEQQIRQGADPAQFEERKKELYESARTAAITRHRLRRVLLRIAEKERIQLTNEDINRAILAAAYSSGEKPEKLARELSKDQERVANLQRSVLRDKALAFVLSKATVSTSAAQPAGA